MHRTNAGKKRKALQREALVLERGARTLQKVKEMSPASGSGRMKRAGSELRLSR
jgi:hypothetical protein